MTDLTRTNSSLVNMADYAAKLRSGIADSRASTVIAGGKPLLRLLKSGEWVFGPSNEEVQPGSHWAINVFSLNHGWSCWVEGQGSQKNELKGEILVPVTEPKPERPPPIQGFDFNEVRAFELKCLDGDDAGTEITHKTSSIGGLRAVDALLASIYRQLGDNPHYPCPVVTLEKDSYQHNKWGKIFTPIFELTGWCDLDGNPSPDPREAITDAAATEPAAPNEAAAPPPAKPKKAALTTAAPAPAEPAPTAANRIGQRRRPAR
jgi:hypothetical protein